MWGGPKKTKMEEARELLASLILTHVPVCIEKKSLIIISNLLRLLHHHLVFTHLVFR